MIFRIILQLSLLPYVAIITREDDHSVLSSFYGPKDHHPTKKNIYIQKELEEMKFKNTPVILAPWYVYLEFLHITFQNFSSLADNNLYLLLQAILIILLHKQ